MTLEHLIFGKLTLSQIPYDNPIIAPVGIVAVIGAIALFIFLTVKKKWGYLWKEWICTVDHKKIGIMYIILSFAMFGRAFIEALMMRLQQAMAAGSNMGYLPSDHYDQFFTEHGVIMIFFMAMPFMFGLLNVALPLKIGARDVAYPYLNSLSLWLTISAAMLVNISFLVGNFAATGWLAYPPLSEITYSPGVGVDYYIWALQISGVGSLLSGINFMATIMRMRCPGMTLMRMPIFAWSALCTSILVVIAFPVLTVTLALLYFDRLMDMHFFTQHFGGNVMMYVNLIWAWGHPEVYILILPAFGIFSEIVPTFCKKKLFGYATMVWAIAVITFLSFVVWLHHFFTMGAGANVNAFFGITTMIIAIPTGVKVFNWLFTMFRGRITFSSPMIWTMGFFTTFAIGGMTGVLMSLPVVDFQTHNSLFLVAHFHNVIIGGVVFGYMAGLIYWFPKMFGFQLDERLGKYAAGFWIGGFYVAFMPLYALGLMGVTRRLSHYSDVAFQPYFVVAAIGGALIAIGVALQFIQLYVSIKNRDKLRDTTGDPWDGRTLEWSLPSPAPFYNFALVPEVHGRDPFWETKQRRKAGEVIAPPVYEDIHMPKDTPMGFLIAVSAGVLGFAMVWHMVLLAIVGGVAMLGFMIGKTFNLDVDYYVKAAEVSATEAAARGGASS
jgi:cytochrome o ubiquinol oxidase subunit I